MKKKPEPEIQGQDNTTWQKRTTRRLTPKKQHQKTMEVFLDEGIRDGIKALAVIRNKPAQDCAEDILVRDVKEKDSLVQEGLKFLKQANGNVTKARLKYLEAKLSDSQGRKR